MAVFLASSIRMQRTLDIFDKIGLAIESEYRLKNKVGVSCISRTLSMEILLQIFENSFAQRY